MSSVAVFKGKLVKFLAKSGILVPARGDVDRSAAPAAGEMAFNTTANKLEVYDGTGWTQLGGIAESLGPVEVAGIPPSLDLDFSADVPSTVTFSRNSIATYFAQDGYLKTASANVPRIEYDPVTRDVKGLLIEEARSNLLVQTEQLFGDKWNVINTTKSITTEIAPDGSTTAVKLIESLDVSSISHYLEYDSSSAVSVISGITYTISIFAKKGERDIFRLDIDNTNGQLDWNSNTPRALVNLTTKTITIESASATSATITDVGNGWYRCSVTGTATQNGTTRPRVVLYSGAAVNYTGDGKSGLYIWGAQLEAGSFPTSYIPSQQTWTARTGTGGTAVASYYDSTGLLKFTGTARTTYNPSPDKLHLSPKLLLEPEATNLYLRSEELDSTVSWSRPRISSVTANTIVAPDGTTTAEKIIEDTTANNSHYVRQSVAVTSGTVYTVSVYAKKAERNELWITFLADNGAFNSISGIFNLDTKVFTQQGGVAANLVAASIQELPNGWYRCSMTATAIATVNGIIGFGTFFSGTPAGTEGIYLWGAQLEAGYAPTSYIPTTTATVKRYADTYTSAVLSGGRLADSASMTGSNFTGWYRWDEGTVYCEASSKGQFVSGVQRVGVSAGITNVDATSIIYLGQTPGVSSRGVISNEGSTQATTPSNTYVAGVTEKMSISFALNNVAGSTDGSTPSLDTSAIIPTKVSYLSIGNIIIGGTRTLNGHIRRLIFWPLRIDNDKLRIMTK